MYNASLDDVEIRADSSPLKLAVYTLGNGTAEEPKHPERIFATLLNPKPGTVCGTSILSGLPFVSSILLRIFESVKQTGRGLAISVLRLLSIPIQTVRL